MLGKVFWFLKMFRRDLVVMMFALFNRDTPRAVKGLLIAAIIYFLSPLDIIPDSIPLLGLLDDAVVLPAAFCGLKSFLPSYVRRDSEMRAERIVRRLPIIIGVATLVVWLWLGLLIYAIVKIFS